MCNLKRQTHSADHVHQNQRPRRAEQLTNAPYTEVEQPAAKQEPIVCKKCKTPHYSYKFACKNCGDYFHNQQQEMTTCPLRRHPRVTAMAVAAVGALLAVSASMMHIF